MWGGGQGGLNLLLPIPFNPGSRPVFFGSRPFAFVRLQNIAQCCVRGVFFPFSRFPPCIFWLPPLCICSIAKYCTMLRNFSLFLPLPATLGILLPAPSSPASRTPPAPFSPGLPPPCPPPPLCVIGSLRNLMFKLHIICCEHQMSSGNLSHVSAFDRRTLLLGGRRA